MSCGTLSIGGLAANPVPPFERVHWTNALGNREPRVLHQAGGAPDDAAVTAVAVALGELRRLVGGTGETTTAAGSEAVAPGRAMDAVTAAVAGADFGLEGPLKPRPYKAGSRCLSCCPAAVAGRQLVKIDDVC